MRDPALVDRGIHQALAGRVVEVDRDFAPERDGEVGDGGRDRRRNQQADVVRRPPGSSQGTAQGQGADQRLAISQSAPVLSAMASLDQRARAWITKALGSEPHSAGNGGNGRSGA